MIKISTETNRSIISFILVIIFLPSLNCSNTMENYLECKKDKRCESYEETDQYGLPIYIQSCADQIIPQFNVGCEVIINNYGDVRGGCSYCNPLATEKELYANTAAVKVCVKEQKREKNSACWVDKPWPLSGSYCWCNIVDGPCYYYYEVDVCHWEYPPAYE